MSTLALFQAGTYSFERVHPGWVQADLGDEIKAQGRMEMCTKNVTQTTTAQSSAGVVAVAKNVTIDSTASFYNYDGSKIPFCTQFTGTLISDNDKYV